MKSQAQQLALQMIKPFGPSIIKVKLPEMIVAKLNEYVDTVLADGRKLQALDHGPKLAGNVNQEFLVETEFLKKLQWAEFLAFVCNEWLQRTGGRQLQEIEVINTWIVRQFKNEYNPVHHHSGHISGVGYLKVPKDMGRMVQKNKNGNPNGRLVFIHGSQNLFCEATFTIMPEVGDFYLFPNYLLHGVYPFSDTDEERRSISFNARLDEAAAAY